MATPSPLDILQDQIDSAADLARQGVQLTELQILNVRKWTLTSRQFASGAFTPDASSSFLDITLEGDAAKGSEVKVGTITFLDAEERGPARYIASQGRITMSLPKSDQPFVLEQLRMGPTTLIFAQNATRTVAELTSGTQP